MRKLLHGDTRSWLTYLLKIVALKDVWLISAGKGVLELWLNRPFSFTVG